MSSGHSGVFVITNVGRQEVSLKIVVIFESCVRRPGGNFMPQSIDRFSHLVQEASGEVKWHCSNS